MKKFVLLAIILPVIALSGAQAIEFLPPPDQRESVAHPAEGDYVVVVHGWAWLRDTMQPMVRHLHDDGYHVVSVIYDARRESPAEVVENRIGGAVREHCRDAKRKIHFVGHSMGCLMIRKFLEEQRPPNLGEVVMLAPPNQGISYVDKFGPRRWFGMIFGDTARMLGQKEESLPNQLGPAVGYEPGIIMGAEVSIPVLSEMLHGPDDGIVSVASGKLEGMREMICVRCIHMRIPAFENAMKQTAHFLKHGRFDESLAGDEPAKERKRVRIGGRKR